MPIDRTLWYDALVDDTGVGDGTPVNRVFVDGLLDSIDAALASIPSGTIPVTTPGGRLTLTSGNPLTSADVTAAGTLYYTAFASNWVWLWNGAAWVQYTFTEVSLALTLTSGKAYDVFLYAAGSPAAPTLELSAAWTNDTTPVDALALQNGINVKSSDHTRLWLGTIYASGANTTEDSFTKRYVSNAYNAMPRDMRRLETNSSWTYTTATWRQANGSASNQLDVVLCRAGLPICVTVMGQAEGSSIGPLPLVAVGLDSTSAPATGCLVSGNKLAATAVGQPCSASLDTNPSRGRHTLVWLEQAVSPAGTVTWYGSNSGLQTGINAEIYG